MKAIFSEEFDRAVHNPRFWIAILISIGFFAYEYGHLVRGEWARTGYSFADLWYYLYSLSYFTYFIPIAAALPFADSLIIDRTQGFLRYLVVRNHYRNYLRAKFLVNALIGAITVMVPLILLYLFTNVITPRAVYWPNTWHPNIAGRPSYIWEPLFHSIPDGFIAVVTMLAGIVGALYASLGMAVSLVVFNRYLALGAPFVVFVLTDFIAQRTNLFGPSWSPIATLAGESRIQIMSQSVEGLFLNPLCVLLLCGILAIFFGRRSRILQ